VNSALFPAASPTSADAVSCIQCVLAKFVPCLTNSIGPYQLIAQGAITANSCKDSASACTTYNADWVPLAGTPVSFTDAVLWPITKHTTYMSAALQCPMDETICRSVVGGSYNVATIPDLTNSITMAPALAIPPGVGCNFVFRSTLGPITVLTGSTAVTVTSE